MPLTNSLWSHHRTSQNRPLLTPPLPSIRLSPPTPPETQLRNLAKNVACQGPRFLSAEPYDNATFQQDLWKDELAARSDMATRQQLPLHGAATMKQLPLHGAATMKQLPLHSASTCQQLPLHRTATRQQLPVHRTATWQLPLHMAARGQQLPLQGAAILSAPASKEYRRRRLQGQLDKETIWGSAWFGEHDSGQHAGEEEEGVDWYPYAPG